MNKKPNILLLYTGGTIGMVEDLQLKYLKPFNFKNIQLQIPELNKINVELTTISFENPIDSSDIDCFIWEKIARIIEINYYKFEGFVILHGTDTMAYTASALSFMFQNLKKPVILTGSQLPIGMIRTDGKENLITAIEIATNKRKNKEPMIQEVAIYFEYKLLRGNRATKWSTEIFAAFHSPNYPLLAHVGIHINYFMENFNKPSQNENFYVKYKFNSNINILYLYPGINENILKQIIETPNLKGIIIKSYGSGNSPNKKWIIDILEEAIKNNIFIYNSTQCLYGRVKQGDYENSFKLKEIGVISAKDLTTEAAITKMMHVLGNESSTLKINKNLKKSLKGEMSI